MACHSTFELPYRGRYACGARRNFAFFEKLIGVRIVTTFYFAKNDHRWVAFIPLKTIGLLLTPPRGRVQDPISVDSAEISPSEVGTLWASGNSILRADCCGPLSARPRHFPTPNRWPYAFGPYGGWHPSMVALHLSSSSIHDRSRSDHFPKIRFGAASPRRSSDDTFIMNGRKNISFAELTFQSCCEAFAAS